MHASRIASRLLPALLAVTGCDEFFGLQQDIAVRVFAAHHGTPEAGNYPVPADPERRIFENDSGWQIILEESFVVITAAELIACDGSREAIPLDAPVAENLESEDLEPSHIGEILAAPGEYCAIAVTYGPYMADDASYDEIHGETVYFRGGAQRGSEHVTFELRRSDPITVELDISDIADGEPLKINGTEHYPFDLTIAKTYDRFFDGVDFSQAKAIDMVEAQTLEILAVETRVIRGTSLLK